MQRLIMRGISCALALLSLCCSAALGQPSPWRVDDANVVFQVSANAQQDAETLRNYELISRVKQLRLEGHVQQAHLDALRGYTMLNELFLDAPKLQSASFVPLQKLSQLSSLTVRSREFTGESLARLRQIYKLDLSGCPISQDGFKALGELRQLRTLNLECTDLSDDTLALLRDLKLLTRLSLANYGLGPPNRITSKGLSVLASHPFIEELSLPVEFSEPSKIDQIPTLKYLKQLYISSETENDLRKISRFGGLEILSVNLKTLTPENVHEIARLKRLRVLNTEYCQISHAAATAIAGCENLEAFYTEKEHSPELLAIVSQLPCLRKLQLMKVSDDDAGQLKKASLLESLTIRNHASDGAMEAIAKLPHLSELHLQSCTPQGILSLKKAKSLELFMLFGFWEEEHEAAVRELRAARPQLEIRQRFGL